MSSCTLLIYRVVRMTFFMKVIIFIIILQAKIYNPCILLYAYQFTFDLCSSCSVGTYKNMVRGLAQAATAAQAFIRSYSQSMMGSLEIGYVLLEKKSYAMKVYIKITLFKKYRLIIVDNYMTGKKLITNMIHQKTTPAILIRKKRKEKRTLAMVYDLKLAEFYCLPLHYFFFLLFLVS